MKVYTKKLFKTALIAFATASIAPVVTAQDTTKLVVWGDPVREPFYKAFDEAKENIEVEFVSIARNEMITKLQLALQSGEGVPDAIFMQDTNFAAPLKTRRVDYLMELQDKVPQETVDGFYPNSNSVCESVF